MTKCERTYHFDRPLDSTLLEAVSKAHGVYGIQKLKVDPSLLSVSVGWDASRLSRLQVESILAGFGLPLKK
jgi:hypothetical protein